MIEVGAGEAIFDKHLENYFRLTGLMRDQPGPSGFRPQMDRHPGSGGSDTLRQTMLGQDRRG